MDKLPAGRPAPVLLRGSTRPLIIHTGPLTHSVHWNILCVIVGLVGYPACLYLIYGQISRSESGVAPGPGIRSGQFDIRSINKIILKSV